MLLWDALSGGGVVRFINFLSRESALSLYFCKPCIEIVMHNLVPVEFIGVYFRDDIDREVIE